MPTNPVLLVTFGVVVGVFSGVMGLGGGSIMIPFMVLVMSMSQQHAHGTSLAVMLPLVTLPAVLKYYSKGFVNIPVAAWMAAGVFLGGYFGALIATSLPEKTLKLVFGLLLIYVAAYTVFGKEKLVRTLWLSCTVVAVTACLYFLTRWYDAAQKSAGV